MGTTFRLVPSSTPSVHPGHQTGDIEFGGPKFDTGIPAKRRQTEQILNRLYRRFEVMSELAIVCYYFPPATKP